MQTVLGIFWHIILALTGALGFAALIAAGAALACGGAFFGGSWCWRSWRGRRGPPGPPAS
jgi:hypothetical protein